MTKNLFSVLLGAAAIVMSVSLSQGCGLGWETPVTHFDDVDQKGHVCYSEKIEDVDFGDDLKLPLIINFRSDRERVSPLLGKGWIVALLESNFVQTGENAFRMTQPDGWVRPFYRAKASDVVLDGGVNWKAEIKGNSITAWASCGWRLVYTKGRIVSIGTPKGRVLEIAYSGDRVAEIRENGQAKLTVAYGDTGGLAESFTFGGKRIVIAHTEKPRVERILNRNVVSGMDQSLRGFSNDSGFIGDRFEYATGSDLAPTMTITTDHGGRTIAWDPATKLITTDGPWVYKITPPEDRSATAAIERVNQSGKSELWSVNPGKGLTTMRGEDGVTRMFSSFTSGKLAGLPRSVAVMGAANKEIVTDQWSYDESARLLRMKTSSPVLGQIEVNAHQPENPNASATVQVKVTRKDGTGSLSYTVQAARGHMVRAD